MQLTRLGPYEINKQLGRGGMGSVYAATDTHTGQRVAIKALSPQLAMAEGFRERFESEIESLKTLKHDGIVRLYGYGEQDGVLFYSMELAEGVSLEDELKAGRRFNWREVANIAIQLSLALKHAHDHGIIHRDIKPANILLYDDERVKLADFGIARLFGTTSLTVAGGVLGTADYMSPEQADGRPVTARCDQYSLGGVMYALLAGRAPFRAKNLPQMLQLQRFAEPEPVRRYAPETPEQLEQVIMQLLSKDPADRFPNTQVLARHLQAMTNALTRPAADDFALSGDHPGGDHVAHDNEAIAYNATQAELEQSSFKNEPQANGISPASPVVHDAPTLGASEALASPALPSSGSTVAATGVAMRQAGLPRPTRFTTIEEEETLRKAQQQRPWLLMIGQLTALSAVLVGIGGIAWYLMRPKTADELYTSVTSHIDADDGASLSKVEHEVKEFLERYPQDPRAPQFEHFRERIELDNLDRKLTRRTHRTALADQSLLPVEQLYLKATGMAKASLSDDFAGRFDSAPEKSLAMLESLVNLYGTDSPAVGQDTSQGTLLINSSERDVPARTANVVQLARRRIVAMRDAIDRQRSRELAAISERFESAEKLSKTDIKAAMAMYQAIIDIHQADSWAETIVDKARLRIAELKK